jgi:hypothetical protein
MPVVVLIGLFALLAIGKLFEPLIGGIGFFLLIGIGLPCIMAASYYAWDLRNRDKFRRK